MKIFRYILVPFSLIYYLAISLRNFFYKVHIFEEHKLGARVISVGNITWGGTGKTPAVLFIAKTLSERKAKVSVLVRGYANDEKDLLLNALGEIPLVAGRDRVKNGLQAISKYSADTLLLDDGFQYRQLKRDIDILCVDASNPFGNGLVIPAGPMREGLSALKRAHIFLITKSDLAPGEDGLKALEGALKRVNPEATVARSIHAFRHFYRLSDERIVDIEGLRDKNLILVSAIGSPLSFEGTISRLGLEFKKHFIFRDHHRYTAKDIKRIGNFCRQHSIDAVITTEKDAIKLQNTEYRIQNTEILVLSVKLEITKNEKEFLNRLFGIYSA